MEQGAIDETDRVRQLLHKAFPAVSRKLLNSLPRSAFDQMQRELSRCRASDIVRLLPLIMEDLLEHHAEDETNYADLVIFFLCPPDPNEDYSLDRIKMECFNRETDMGWDAATIDALTKPLPGPKFTQSDFDRYFELIAEDGAGAIAAWLKLALKWSLLEHARQDIMRALDYWSRRSQSNRKRSEVEKSHRMDLPGHN